MNKASVLFLAIAFSIVSAATVTAEARSLMPSSHTYTVQGTRAEFLFNKMSEFENVKGLAGTADCAMGTCGTVMNEVTCTKVVEGDPQQKPGLFCSVRSTDSNDQKVNFITITNRSRKGGSAVSGLRRAMIDAIGRQPDHATRNTIYAHSIACRGTRLNIELDELGFEQTFECTIETY